MTSKYVTCTIAKTLPVRADNKLQEVSTKLLPTPEGYPMFCLDGYKRYAEELVGLRYLWNVQLGDVSLRTPKNMKAALAFWNDRQPASGPKQQYKWEEDWIEKAIEWNWRQLYDIVLRTDPMGTSKEKMIRSFFICFPEPKRAIGVQRKPRPASVAGPEIRIDCVFKPPIRHSLQDGFKRSHQRVVSHGSSLTVGGFSEEEASLFSNDARSSVSLYDDSGCETDDSHSLQKGKAKSQCCPDELSDCLSSSTCTQKPAKSSIVSRSEIWRFWSSGKNATKSSQHLIEVQAYRGDPESAFHDIIEPRNATPQRVPLPKVVDSPLSAIVNQNCRYKFDDAGDSL